MRTTLDAEPPSVRAPPHAALLQVRPAHLSTDARKGHGSGGQAMLWSWSTLGPEPADDVSPVLGASADLLPVTNGS